MQLRLPWSSPPPASPRTHLVRLGDADEPVTIARHARARRYVLRVAADGSLRLTVPRGASIRGGLNFVARQADWVARERRRRAAQGAWDEGTPIWWRGERLVVGRDPDGGTTLGADRMPPPRSGLAPRAAFERWARELAARELPVRCLELASACGEQVREVRVRNQRSRWGSCSPRRVIALNWRLIQMPPFVADYVILHELMHLRQPNHSRRFWREVDRVCDRWREAERWLRRHGRDVL
ncbi:MAG: SprT family zinc-dependent metalloprotease [Vicinamibacterales bacterium]